MIVSGGNDPDRLFAAVVRADDGKVLAKATGRGTEQYRRVMFDLAPHIGERVYVEVVDRGTGAGAISTWMTSTFPSTASDTSRRSKMTLAWAALRQSLRLPVSYWNKGAGPKTRACPSCRVTYSAAA